MSTGRTAAVCLALCLGACAQVPVAEPEMQPRAEVPPAPVGERPAPREQEPQPPQAAAAAAESAPAPPPQDVWDRIRGGFRLAPLASPLVQEWEQWYSKRPDYVARLVERGSRFLFHVIEEVERRNMPSEIALLPIIESAYNPQAYSRAHASGIWQFIPSTGKLYGLRQNFWYDGRRDVLAATSAALDYLEKLHAMFGDWNLALASYNWGEGAVSRAIARNQAKGLPTDYESLTMPAETRNYVPKLMAVRNIVANPQQFGLTLAPIPNRPYLATVTTRTHIDVKLAARFAEMPLEEFRFLNPAHNKPVIRSDGSETIVLPVDRVEAFRRNLAAHDQPLVTWQAYTVKRSDTQESIASRHGITVARLREVNGIAGNRRIVAGQTLLVPVNGGAEPYLPDLPAPKVTPVRAQSPAQKSRCVQVTLKSGKKQTQCPSARKPPAKAAPSRPAVKM